MLGKSMHEILLTPNYENTAKWFAHALKDHSFDRGANQPIISFIEQIRYLTQTDLPAVQRVINNLNPVLEGITIITPEGSTTGRMYDDDHLEADYDDRQSNDSGDQF